MRLETTISTHHSRHHLKAFLYAERLGGRPKASLVVRGGTANLAILALEADCPELGTPCMGPETTISTHRSQQHIYALFMAKALGGRLKASLVVRG